MRRVAAVVPAAGRGQRMGAPINKSFLNIAGVPVLAHTLRALQSISARVLEQIVVALGPGEAQLFEEMVQPHLRPAPEVLLVVGGRDRQSSVYKALERVNPQIDLVLVHDGARPLLTPQVVQRCLEEVGQNKCVVAAIPATDTLKLVDSARRVYETLPRDKIWHVQTPQVFPRGILLDAHQRALADGYVGSDDASLVERLGYPVHIVLGDERNLKITTPMDLLVAAALMKANDVE